jgi:hypothetical protein
MKFKSLKGMAAAFLVMAALMPVSVLAAELRGDKSGVTSVNDAIGNDLYAAGSGVSVSGAVSGDALLAGGNVSVSGNIGEGLFAAGGTVTVMGNVSDDLRIIGGNIFINGVVAHDVVVLGGQVNISSSATIGKDLIVLGGTVIIDGAVNGNVFVRGGEVTISAPIKGSVDAAAKKLAFGSAAKIGGKLIYSSPTEMSLPSGLAQAGVEYKKMIVKTSDDAKGVFAAFMTIGLLIKLVSIFVLALIFTVVFKKRSSALVQSAFAGFGWNLLYGFAAMILIPIAALILLVTVLGAPLALMAMCAYGILLVVSGFFAPVLIGAWILKLTRKAGEYPMNIYAVLIGTLVYGLAGLIPVLGWVFDCVFMLVALGALSRAVTDGLRAMQGEKRVR